MAKDKGVRDGPADTGAGATDVVVLMDEERVKRSLARIAHEIAEQAPDGERVVRGDPAPGWTG